MMGLVVPLAVEFCRCEDGGATCGAQLPEHSAHSWRTNPDRQVTNYTLPAKVRGVAAIDALPRPKDECPRCARLARVFRERAPARAGPEPGLGNELDWLRITHGHARARVNTREPARTRTSTRKHARARTRRHARARASTYEHARTHSEATVWLNAHRQRSSSVHWGSGRRGHGLAQFTEAMAFF